MLFKSENIRLINNDEINKILDLMLIKIFIVNDLVVLYNIGKCSFKIEKNIKIGKNQCKE